MNAITIVTVAGPNDGPLIQRNAELIQEMNGHADTTIHVIDNSRYSGGEPIKPGKLWIVEDGVPMDSPELGGTSQASAQHGAALNRFFRNNQIETRYCLVLDPDFFIMHKDWIASVISHMKENNLAFFGAPWHPKWFTKYRYFPCVHCLFIDTKQVRLNLLDFAPKLRESVATSVRKTAVGGRLNRSRLSPFFKFIYLMSLLRMDIGRSKDTGYRILEFFRKNRSGLGVGLLTPYVKPDDWSKVIHLRYAAGRLMERFIPDRLSFIPHSRGYFTNRSQISETLSRDVKSLVWEEFQWRGQFFGLHMRRFVNSDNYAKLNQKQLLETLISELRERSYG